MNNRSQYRPCTRQSHTQKPKWLGSETQIQPVRLYQGVDSVSIMITVTTPTPTLFPFYCFDVVVVAVVVAHQYQKFQIFSLMFTGC